MYTPPIYGLPWSRWFGYDPGSPGSFRGPRRDLANLDHFDAERVAGPSLVGEQPQRGVVSHGHDTLVYPLVAVGIVTSRCGRLSPAAGPTGGTGLWRSLVAHLTGGQVVAGSNPVSPTKERRRWKAVFRKSSGTAFPTYLAGVCRATGSGNAHLRKSDRILGNAGRGRNLFDGFAFGDLAGGPCFGRRQIEQRLQQ